MRNSSSHCSNRWSTEKAKWSFLMAVERITRLNQSEQVQRQFHCVAIGDVMCDCSSSWLIQDDRLVAHLNDPVCSDSLTGQIVDIGLWTRTQCSSGSRLILSHCLLVLFLSPLFWPIHVWNTYLLYILWTKQKVDIDLFGYYIFIIHILLFTYQHL